MTHNLQNLSAIILAAGRGKRMNHPDRNKVTSLLHGKPVILYTVELLEKKSIRSIIVVLGHAADTVKEVLKDHDTVFAYQEEQKGTAHAVISALPQIPDSVTDIIVMYGDDGYAYDAVLLDKILNAHSMNNSTLTFMTIDVDDPSGLGRVIRDDNNNVIDIVEEKDASDGQKKIKEINPNLYIFKKSFLEKYLPQIEKSPVTGEYYLPALIALARKNSEKMEVIHAGRIPWRGINTPEDLRAAGDLFKK